MKKPYAIVTIKYEDGGQDTRELATSLEVEELIHQLENSGNLAADFAVYVLTLHRTCEKVWKTNDIREEPTST
jgi:hypothetical protein